MRDDGLFDVEAHLTDVKDHDLTLLTGVRRRGEPVHDMWVRLTIDRELTIRAMEASMDAVPYPGGCERIEDAYESSSARTSCRASGRRCTTRSVARRAART